MYIIFYQKWSLQKKNVFSRRKKKIFVEFLFIDNNIYIYISISNSTLFMITNLYKANFYIYVWKMTRKNGMTKI